MESFYKSLLLLLSIDLLLFCGKEDSSDHGEVVKAKNDIQIVPYNAERDDKQLENIVNQCEEELETNWWTCKRYRLNQQHITLVARDDENKGKIIGFILYWNTHTMPHVKAGNSHIDLLVIDPPYRKKGYGRQLLQYAIKQLREEGMQQLTIDVFAKNHVAQKLYKSEGFKFSGTYASTGNILPRLVKNLQETRS